MLRTLTPHRDCVCTAVAAITVEVLRTRARTLSLRYLVAGDPSGLRLPALAAPARADELWRHTCFEAFVAGPDAKGYLEINLSPSRRWAAYRFDGYRRGMQPIDDVPAPTIELETRGDGLELRAELDLAGASQLPERGPWKLGLSAVIEQAGGRLSYWALAHPPGRPDFHHANCFAAELVAPQRA